MPNYPSLSALRAALTADDPDKRAEAYSDVMNVDLQPSEVLATEPGDAVVQSLADGGVIPETASDPGKPAVDQRQEIIDLLTEIRDNTAGSA